MKVEHHSCVQVDDIRRFADRVHRHELCLESIRGLVNPFDFDLWIVLLKFRNHSVNEIREIRFKLHCVKADDFVALFVDDLPFLRFGASCEYTTDAHYAKENAQFN